MPVSLLQLCQGSIRGITRPKVRIRQLVKQRRKKHRGQQDPNPGVLNSELRSSLSGVANSINRKFIALGGDSISLFSIRVHDGRGTKIWVCTRAKNSACVPNPSTLFLSNALYTRYTVLRFEGTVIYRTALHTRYMAELLSPCAYFY